VQYVASLQFQTSDARREQKMNYSRLLGVEGSHVRYERHFWKSIIVFLGERGERERGREGERERETSGIAHSSFLLERHESETVNMVRSTGRISTICLTAKF